MARATGPSIRPAERNRDDQSCDFPARGAMTPGARVAAAIEVLDAVLAGASAEQVLTNWARKSRFAGSGDRAGVRDLVFDALRHRRSYGALGQGTDGRALMLGALRARNTAPGPLFSGIGHAPAPLTGAETAQFERPVEMPEAVALDCPDWLEDALRGSLGADFTAVMQALQQRAPVFVRANLARTTRAGAQAALLAEGIGTRPVDWVNSALEVIENARKVQASAAFRSGLVDLQDAASQAVVAALPITGGRVLDYCAGGGGKTLALAARDPRARFFAHDANPGRMRDLPARAARAGVEVTLLAPGKVSGAPFDLVVLDVPCSGSGSWRRAPQGKWDLTPGRLRELVAVQAKILDQAVEFVSENGTLAYITCSLLDAENVEQAQAFVARHPGWALSSSRRLTPLDGGDGFFLALFKRI